jgi:glycosyltransferase involved in cell wall biosynthesis
MKILTTYPIPENPRWVGQTELVQSTPAGRFLDRVSGLVGLRNSKVIVQLLKMRRDYDVLITGAEREDCLFAVLQTVLPGRRIPHIMMCCLWKQESNRAAYWLKKSLLRLVSRSVAQFVVWSTEELRSYPDYFGIEPERFVFVPYHATLGGEHVRPVKGDYVFAGGDSVRDYATLLEAFADLDIPLVIAAKNRQWRKVATGMKHVTVDEVSPRKFRELMAAARLVVVPIEKGTMRGAGQQTYLTAMELRKPVIVTEAPGVHDHIEHGKTGWIVPAADAVALRTTIEHVWQEGQDVLDAIDAAQSAVNEQFTLAHFVDRSLGIAHDLVEHQHPNKDFEKSIAFPA